MDKEHYISPSETREHIERLKLSHMEQKKFLPDLCKKNSDVSAGLVSDKAKDRANTNIFQATKPCAITICNNLNAPRCIFSLNGIGSSNGPSQGYLVKLQGKIEYAYLCGDGRTIVVVSLLIPPSLLPPGNGASVVSYSRQGGSPLGIDDQRMWRRRSRGVHIRPHPAADFFVRYSASLIFLDCPSDNLFWAKIKPKRLHLTPPHPLY